MSLHSHCFGHGEQGREGVHSLCLLPGSARLGIRVMRNIKTSDNVILPLLLLNFCANLLFLSVPTSVT